MKLIWHIIRKDIVQFRWALLAWALLYAGQIGLGLSMLHMDHPNLEEAAWLQWGNWLLVFLQSATGYLLVTQFVQADGLAGTRMFWLTRPISARRLLAAKALGVLLVFAVLPVLLLLPWWLYCGFDARTIAWTAGETFGWQLLMIAPAFLIAALTEEISRALLWTLLLVTGLGAWIIWAQFNLKTSLVESRSVNFGLLFSRLWLAAMILVAGSVIVSIHHFLTRRLYRSMLLTLPVLGLIVLVGRFWPWDCSVLIPDLSRPEPAPLATGDTFAAVQFTLGPAQITSRDRDNPPINHRQPWAPHTWILQTLQVRGLSADLVIQGRAPDQSWRWPEGATEAQKTTYFSSWSDRTVRKALGLPEKSNEDPETKRWWQERRDKDNADRLARGLKPFRARPTLLDSGAMLGSTRLPDSLVERLQAEPPASQLRVEAEVGRPEILLELPLQAGARATSESHSLRITNVFRPHASQHATLGVVLTRPGLSGNGLWGMSGLNRDSRDLPRSLMVLDRTDADWGSAWLRYGEGEEPVRAQVAGVDVHWAICGITAPQVIRDGHWVEQYDHWFEHSTLAVLGTKPVARFTREVKTDKFELEPDSSDKPTPNKSF